LLALGTTMPNLPAAAEKARIQQYLSAYNVVTTQIVLL